MAPQEHSVLVLPGDGIGPEIMAEALKTLEAISSSSSGAKHTFSTTKDIIGGSSIDVHGSPVTEGVKKAAAQADAVLFACVGGPKWDDARTGFEGPEGGLLQLRRSLDVFANLRPCGSPCEAVTTKLSPYREDVVRGADFVVLRENCGGAYFGKKIEEADYAMDEWSYSTSEVERITRLAAHVTRKHNQNLPSSATPWPIISLDKANVLASSRLWRRVVTSTLSNEFPDVKFSHQLADSASLLMATNPRSLNGVLLSDNTFGDMLSDQAGSIAGSLGVLPSASLSGVPGEGKKVNALYEPTHGSAPTLAGKNVANPVAMILCVALMFRYSFDMEHEARVVEKAVTEALEAGVRTADLGGKSSTTEVGDAVVERVKKALGGQ